MSGNVRNRLRLLAVDMDGTVLMPDSTVSAVTLTALRRVIDEGLLMVPASGRSFRGIPKEILDLGVLYVITANGTSFLSDDGEWTDLFSVQGRIL